MTSNDWLNIKRCATARTALHFLADDGPRGRAYRESQSAIAIEAHAFRVKFREMVHA